MSNRTKNIIYSIILVAAVFIVSKYRQHKNASQAEPVKIEGKTMGTSYHITYFDPANRNFKFSVDSLLAVINKSINNYDPTSEVSRFNKHHRGVAVELPYLVPSLKVAYQMYEISGGAFDPTVMPLVNAWGFGPGKKLKMDSAKVDSIRQYIGFNKVEIREDSLVKSDPHIQIDFGGIGQGYGADVITEFLKTKGIEHMLVEVGGEGMAIGRNIKSDKPWEIGILDPNSTYENQFFKAYIKLEDESFTTSGSYFNFYEEDGVKYAHSIDPKTGWPARQALLSASVFAKDCTTADVWGTALMVLGHEEGSRLVEKHPEVQVIFMYSDGTGKINTYVTPGLREKVTIEESHQNNAN